MTLPGIAATAVMLAVIGVQAHTGEPAPVSSPTATHSSAAARPTTRVVGIGDSVMSGTACGCEGIPALYARALAARLGGRVSAGNLGEGGSTADSTEAALKASVIDRDVVSSAAVLLVIVGANDLGPADDRYEVGGCDTSCYGPWVTAMEGHLRALLKDLRQLVGPRTQILVGTYWNVFPDGEPSIVPGGVAELAWSRALTVDTNGAICRAAESSSTRCVDLATPFFGAGGASPLLADDGDHPNGAGVDAIVASLIGATDVRALGRG